MWHIYDGLVLSFFGLWFLCSCIAQRRVLPRVLRRDQAGLIPNCRFFAPRPVSFDLSVYLRTQDERGCHSSWQPLVEGDKTSLCFVWNPSHRLRKTVYDLTDMLQQQDRRETWHLSYPYLLLLNACTTAARSLPEHGRRVQFVITARAGYEDIIQNIIFLSHFHPY
jgi:hypothetical protein